MRRRWNRLLPGWLATAIVVVAGCGPAAAPFTAESARTSATATPTQAEATPVQRGAAPLASTPISTPTTPLTPAWQDSVRQAREDLAQRLGLDAGQIDLVDAQAVVWPDTGLGCPQPGMAYAQASTAGFRVILEAEQERYAYHTDAGRVVVLCESGEVAKEEIVSDEPLSGVAETSSVDEMVAKAKEDLARRLSIGVDQISLREAREVTWPDASLGCPQPGMVYAQVLQDGLLIRLSAGGRIYFYHSGGSRDPFLCEQSPLVPQTPDKIDELIPPPDSEID
ncbi:MAG: hypothetical protein ACE5H9_12865 [Anaerolineae bacterium]